MSIAERGGGGVLVQSALSSQFRRLARKDPPAEVALKVFSDVVSAVSPILLDEARQLLLRLETPHRQRAWIEAGPEAKAQAQALLTGHAPKLIGAVAAGQLLGPEGVE
jgi:hypothetical protein